MNKPFIEMTEKELRILIEKRAEQYNKAQDRVDRFGSFKCISQAEKYLMKYVDLLFIAYNKGFALSEEEKQTVSLKKMRIA